MDALISTTEPGITPLEPLSTHFIICICLGKWEQESNDCARVLEAQANIEVVFGEICMSERRSCAQSQG
jgi:hypothetical protein